MSVAGERAAGAVLGNRNPPSEEWPHRSLVVAYGVVETCAFARNSSSPIGRKLIGRPAREHLLALIECVVSIPPRDGRKYGCRFIHSFASVPTESIGVSPFLVVLLFNLALDFGGSGIRVGG